MEEGRTLVYRMMYLGLPFAVLYLAGLYFDWPTYILGPIGGGMAGLLIATATSDNDEFFAAELAFASKALVCALGLLAIGGISATLWESTRFDARVAFGILACVFFLALMAKRVRG